MQSFFKSFSKNFVSFRLRAFLEGIYKHSVVFHGKFILFVFSFNLILTTCSLSCIVLVKLVEVIEFKAAVFRVSLKKILEEI